MSDFNLYKSAPMDNVSFEGLQQVDLDITGIHVLQVKFDPRSTSNARCYFRIDNQPLRSGNTLDTFKPEGFFTAANGEDNPGFYLDRDSFAQYLHLLFTDSYGNALEGGSEDRMYLLAYEPGLEENNMSLTTPAYTGGESVVGFAREAAYGTVPTTGANPNKTFGSAEHPAKFLPVKEESFDPTVNADPQMDDLDQNREVSRIIANGNTNDGALRLIPGPESIGYFLTMLFGSPSTTQLAASSGGTDNDVYQHIWYPGLNTRGNWPVPYSVESRLSSVRSKIIAGAIIRRLPIDIPNNGAMTISPDFFAKSMQMIQGDGTSGTNDPEGNALPCCLTANPTMISETEWHWRHLKAYPQIDGADEQGVTACNFEFAFPDIRGLFTGGSGQNIGTYALDKFQISGRSTILFEDEDLWYKIKSGTYFKIDATLEGAVIQGAHKNALQIIAYSCKASEPGLANRVGDLAYDFFWTGRKDPTEGKSCQITLINSVASYAA